MQEPLCLLKITLSLCLVLSVCLPVFSQTGTGSEPVRYIGGVTVDPSVHDGRLRPAIGVESRQIMRANRTHPEWSDGYGWTYNHAPNLAYWGSRFYLEYLSNPVGEHIPPGQTLVITSKDGRNWSMPEVVFPPYKLPEGGTAMMHQRMGFFIAPNNRLLVLAFYARAPNPFGKGGIGRVVREARADGTYGPIHFIRYNTASGWDENNTNYPFFKRSNDPGFVDACNALLANRLIRQQWYDEDKTNDDFFGVKGSIQAFCFYHRKDGKVVGLWKWSLSALSSDEGASWTPPVKVPTLIMDGAKVWGQRTADNRYALVYNPADDSNHRYPLAMVTGDDGILFDNMLLVNGEVPPRRYLGKYKDWGSMYVRGIIPGDGNPPGTDMWISYSVSKEDMFISRIPVPVRDKVTGPVKDTFDPVKSGGNIPNWNINTLLWAPVNVVDFPSAANKSLELQDKDPSDYARAVRVFQEGTGIRARFKVFAKQADTGRLEIEIMDRFGNRPVRLHLADDGKIKAMNGSKLIDLAPYKPGTWYNFVVTANTKDGTYSVSIDGKPVLNQAAFAEAVKTLERLSFRTGPYRDEPTRKMNPEPGPGDMPNVDDPVLLAVYNVDDVEIGPAAAVPSGNAP